MNTRTGALVCQANANTDYGTTDVLLGFDDCVPDDFTGYLREDHVFLGPDPRVLEIGPQILNTVRPIPVTVGPCIIQQPGQRFDIGPLKIA